MEVGHHGILSWLMRKEMKYGGNHPEKGDEDILFGQGLSHIESPWPVEGGWVIQR
jgi:hypothetical protein